MTTKPGRPSDQVKRDAIVEAASQSFFALGFAATSIEQVAAQAGVSKVTIYNNFGDKRALFAAAVSRECEKMQGIFRFDQLTEGTIEERLRTIAQTMMAFFSRPEIIQFDRRIAAETEHEPEIGATFLNSGPRRMKGDFSAFLARISDSGELNIPDPELAAEQFVAMVRGMGDLERRFGFQPERADDARRMEGAIALFLKAYRP